MQFVNYESLLIDRGRRTPDERVLPEPNGYGEGGCLTMGPPLRGWAGDAVKGTPAQGYGME